MFYEILGWYGAAALIGGYFLNSFGVIESSSIFYQLLNMSGAIGIMIISYKDKAQQTFTVNLIWLLIGLVALFKM